MRRSFVRIFQILLVLAEVQIKLVVRLGWLSLSNMKLFWKQKPNSDKGHLNAFLDLQTAILWNEEEDKNIVLTGSHSVFEKKQDPQIQWRNGCYRIYWSRSKYQQSWLRITHQNNPLNISLKIFILRNGREGEFQ